MEIPPFEDLIYEVDGHVCTLTMNRPQKKNALSPNLVNELIVALETARDDAEVRVIVLTGAGDCFCSGGDLGGMGKKSDVPQRGGFVELNLAMQQIGKPVIAKVRKYALAGGLGLMCACQFAIAEQSATFGTPEIDRGIFPMMIMANIFRAVPRRKGLELIFLGERIDAAAAENMGLITHAVPDDQLDSAVAELAEKLASKSPVIMKLGLEAFYKQSDMAIEDSLPYLNDMLQKCFATDDAKEGIMAFMQKRKPVWKGK
ncbi:MAG: enoyl-CoA hydratase/isomerase family protein [Chrysiogenetes bacterium]|nr:enoyl-CoA hydratase/isomerase family protein [Chrysiogenetes bacterium]